MLKERFQKIYQHIFTEMWTVQDIGIMLNGSSVIYKRAMALGIPDSFARHFIMKLNSFVPHWQQIKIMQGIMEQEKDKEDEDE